MKISFVPASLFARLFFLFLAGIAILPVNGAVWQWSVGVKSEKPENGPARAWLWIPPNCKQVRGVVVAQHNMEEISILENPKFRKALRSEEHTSELQSRQYLVCRLLLEK